MLFFPADWMPDLGPPHVGSSILPPSDAPNMQAQNLCVRGPGRRLRIVPALLPDPYPPDRLLGKRGRIAGPPDREFPACGWRLAEEPSRLPLNGRQIDC